MLSTPTDKELIQLLQDQKEEAIDLIFRKYYPLICRAVLRVLSDVHQAEDLAQEVFYELWRKRDSLQINTSLKAYLQRSARNKSLNFIRDQKIKFDDSDELPVLSSNFPSITQELEASELQARIDQAINSLPERCRIIFVLSRFEELSYQEIANQLDISIKTVENQISRALKLLRHRLGKSRE